MPQAKAGNELQLKLKGRAHPCGNALSAAALLVVVMKFALNYCAFLVYPFCTCNKVN